MQIIGHRGARGLAPENTILAIRVALREKVDMIELDVRMNENTLILSHDPVKSSQEYTTLHDGLAKIKGKVPLNIEIKPQKHVTPEDVVLALRRELNAYKGHVVVSSYSFAILKEVKNHLPNVELAILEKWSGVRATAKASLLHTNRIHINHNALWSGFVRSMKHHGYSLYAYTVNHRDRADELEKWGVDGICTDYPNLFR